MQRIAVVGTSGSGKTSLGEQLSQRLGLPLTDLDAIHWLPGWQSRPLDDMRAQIGQVTAAERWIITGNYSALRDLIWGRADTLIWLDYPLRIVLWRLFRRTLKRIVTREPLWGTGNVERWSNFTSLKPEDNIMLWAITSQPKHRREYPRLFSQPAYAHLRVLHQRHPRDTQRWLESLG